MNRVTFTFDERSLASMREPIGPVMGGTNPPPVQMTITLRDPNGTR